MLLIGSSLGKTPLMFHTGCRAYLATWIGSISLYLVAGVEC